MTLSQNKRDAGSLDWPGTEWILTWAGMTPPTAAM